MPGLIFRIARVTGSPSRSSLASSRAISAGLANHSTVSIWFGPPV
jgi:hypothetical protein